MGRQYVPKNSSNWLTTGDLRNCLLIGWKNSQTHTFCVLVETHFILPRIFTANKIPIEMCSIISNLIIKRLFVRRKLRVTNLFRKFKNETTTTTTMIVKVSFHINHEQNTKTNEQTYKTK